MTTKLTQVANDDRLLLDVIEALRGAENLRERIHSIFQSGSPSVSDLSYAIKSRVKEDYKAVEKIKDRRVGGEGKIGNPDYQANNLTDLVGIRVVTLYRLDVIDVIRLILDHIKQGDGPSSVFIGDSVSEINIYSTNPDGDVQNLPERVLGLCRENGFQSVAKIEGKPSNYSSIHIVVRGRGKYREEYREIPVEIQVRTALEDVWGQIEHTLKYKRKRMAAVGDKSASASRLTTTLSHLGALKTMIDGIAQYGDQIKLQIDELEPELRYLSSKSVDTDKQTRVRLDKLSDLPLDLKEELLTVVAEAEPALSDRGGLSQERVRSLRQGISKLEDVWRRFSTLDNVKQRTINEVSFVIDMQRALLHFQLGNLIKSDSHLAESLAIYGNLEKKFPKRLVISYRFARALDSVGLRDDAIDKLRKVVACLESPSEPTPKTHWIRSAAPRILGVLYWEKVKADIGDIVGAKINGEDNIALLKEALLCSEKAYVAGNGNAGFESDERSKAANNLLYFILEYLDAGGQPLEAYDSGKIAALLNEIGGERPDKLPSVNAADTARRAHAYLGSKALEQASARRVLEVAAQGAAARTPFEREAIREAEVALGMGAGNPLELEGLSKGRATPRVPLEGGKPDS